MALLVGDNSTQTAAAAPPANKIGFAPGGYVASASGTAATAYVRISNVYLATALKVLVYTANGSTLLATATFTSLATGWLSAALDSSISIVSGTTYILGAIAGANVPDIYVDSSAWNMASDALGSYDSPPTSVTVEGDGNGWYNYGKMSIYLDGSAGGGATFPVPALGLKRHKLIAKRLGLFS